jgi:primary-amine oxidase
VVQGLTNIVPLNYIYNKGEGKSPNYHADYYAQQDWLMSIARSIEDITLDILGMVRRNNISSTS